MAAALGLANGLMRYVGRACCQVGIRGVGLAAGGVVGEIAAEVLLSVAEKAWSSWKGEGDLSERIAALEALAKASPSEARAAAEAIAAEEVPDATPEERQALAQYLTQIPAQVRRTLRRPTDPTGTTATPNLVPKSAEELIPLLPTRPPRFQAGERVPGAADWVLEEPLGMGGFGEVWLGRNLHLGDVAAFKFCLDPAAARSLPNEAHLLGRIKREARHPGIVALEDTQLSGATPWLRYEYVKGGDLAGLIAQIHADTKLTTEQRTGKLLGNFRQLVNIVAHCHTLNPPIVHRDLKPANILVESDGKGTEPRLRVTDFGIGGIASKLTLQRLQGGSTSRGEFFATALRGAHTPLYAGPQQMQGEPPDPSDDVFSLAVIAYQMLKGNLAQGAPRGKAWRAELSRGTPLPEDFVDLMVECWEDARSDRPPNAGQMVKRIAEMEIGQLELPAPGHTHPNGRPDEEAVRQTIRAWIVSVEAKWDEAAFQRFLSTRFLRQPGFHLIDEAEARTLASQIAKEWLEARAKKLEAERQALEAIQRKREQEEAAKWEVERLAKERHKEEAARKEAEAQRGKEQQHPVPQRKAQEPANNPYGCGALLLIAVLLGIWWGIAAPFGDSSSRWSAGSQAGERRVLQIASGVEMPFRWCPPGTFLMGSPQSEEGRAENEGPQTKVTLTRGFWIGETEATQAQYKAVTGQNPSRFEGPDSLPVEKVYTEDARAFCAELSAKVGEKIALPTEAQWEYACRAGTTTSFSFGDSEGDLDRYAWFSGNSDRQTRPVGEKEPNAWGLYDMHGNVNEWCDSMYERELPGGAVVDYMSNLGGTDLARGGSYLSPPRSLRSASRWQDNDGPRHSYHGFRVVILP